MKKALIVLALLIVPACGFDLKKHCDGPINVSNVSPANLLISSNTGTFPVTLSLDLINASGEVSVFANVIQPLHPELNVTIQTYIGNIGMCTSIAMSLTEVIDTTGMVSGETGDIFLYARETSNGEVVRSGNGSTIHYTVQ